MLKLSTMIIDYWYLLLLLLMSDHSFVRSSDETCDSCLGCWGSSSGTLTRFFRCSSCGEIIYPVFLDNTLFEVLIAVADLSIHGDCKEFSIKSFPCQQLVRTRKTQWASDTRIHGSLLVLPLQARDISFASTYTTFFCSYKLSRIPAMRSTSVTIGDGDCRWSSDIQATKIHILGRIVLFSLDK